MGFPTVLVNVAILVAFSIPGYLLMRFKKIKDEHVKGLVIMLIMIAQPAMVAKSFLSLKFEKALGINILIAIGSFALVMILVLMLASVVFRNWRKKQNSILSEQELQTQKDKKATNRMYRFASMFGNTGYLGLPLVSALFPGNNIMLLYTSLCIVMFNIMTWTLGVYVITGDKQYISLKRAFVTPVIITTLCTLPFFFIKSVELPKEIISFFSTLGAMTTPLSMLIMGARMAQLPFLSIFNQWRVYVVCALRLTVAPLIAFALMKLFNITDRDLYNTVIVICAMPTAAAAILFAERFLPDSYTAVKTVLASSILCIATIPLFLYLFLI